MTEPAPSHGERTMSEDVQTMTHGMNCSALGGDEADCTCGLEWRIHLETEKAMHAAWRKRAEESEQQLTAATARAEQAEAACVEMHKALGFTCLFREFMDEWHDMQNPNVVHFRELREKALSSDSGKSTADELRRLRDENAAMHRSLTALFYANASGDERDVNEAVEFAGIVLNRIAVQAAQPERAQRSE